MEDLENFVDKIHILYNRCRMMSTFRSGETSSN